MDWMGVSRTVRLLREQVRFPKLAYMTKEYIESCLPCSIAVPVNLPAPIIIQEMAERPWQVLKADYNGPIRGTKWILHSCAGGLLQQVPGDCDDEEHQL